jgi:hypothetical protein
MKSTWVTALEQEPGLAQKTVAELRRFGLASEGHFWIDDLASMAWVGVLEKMKEERPSLWVILASDKALAEPNIRYGLSLLSLAVKTHLESLPIVVLGAAGEAPAAQAAPPLLKNALYLAIDSPAWQAKLVALANLPAAAGQTDYYLDAYGSRELGQWFEVGPSSEQWQGALFAVAGAEINFHAVGPRGKLPERSTISYSQKGLKLEVNGVEYTGWALRNELSPADSYFVRVQGEPGSLVFGAYPEGDASDFFVQALK